MAQFDVHRLSGTLVVDVQSDLIDGFGTRWVAPMAKLGSVAHASRINPVVVFGDDRWIVRVHLMAGVRQASLKSTVGNLAHARDDIFRAIDLITHGF